MFACKLKTDIPFLGRQAVEEAKAEGPRRKLVSFVVERPEPMLWSGELMVRGGVAAGQVTSAAWGESLGACCGLGYVWNPDGGAIDREWVRQGGFEVDVNGSLEPVSVSLRPPFDPDGTKIRP